MKCPRLPAGKETCWLNSNAVKAALKEGIIKNGDIREVKRQGQCM